MWVGQVSPLKWVKNPALLTYMAPEQINEHPVLSSDQYALAAVVYEWLCGQPLFEGTALQVCLQHMSTPPPRLRERVRSISPNVERVVLKALSKDPSQRFAHILEFAYALQQASRDSGYSGEFG